jgi:membrane-associated phospholipid phosphatase
VPLAAGAEPRPLRHDLALDGAITATAIAAWIGTELAKERLAPSACRVCAPGPLDAAARKALVWGHGARARRVSDLLAFAVVPAGLAAHQLLAARAAGDASEGLVDLLIVAQAAALAIDLDQMVKFASGRQRPFVRHGNWLEPSRRPDPDDDLSFYSGHTTLAFSAAAAAGTVSSLRGYRSAPAVWAAGFALAGGVGYLRIASDSHYLTDVLAGAVAGTAIGIAAPRLLHGRRSTAGAGAQATTPVIIALALPF